MNEPILASGFTWFTQGGTKIAKDSISEIEFMDNYTPDTSVTVKDSWDASAAKDETVMCYVIGTKLIIAGNGSGKIVANENSGLVFLLFSNVTNIRNASIFDTSNATTFSGMFLNCYALSNVEGIETWETKKVADMSSMFLACRGLRTLDLSNWDTSKVTTMELMFKDCYALESLYSIAGWNVSNVTTMKSMMDRCEAITTLDLSKWNTSSVTTTELMFENCPSLKAVDLSNWNLEKLTNMAQMFYDCGALTEVRTSNWNVNNVISMSSMFNGDSSLISIGDVSNWNPSSCTDMSFMFYGCSRLGEIDVSKWDVSKVTNFDHFAAHANLKRRGIENWNTSSATNMNAMFHNCAEKELDLSGWDVSKVQFFCQMFENSPNLKRIKGLENWNTSAGLGFDGMFERCSALEEVDLSSFNTTKAKNGTSASANGHKTATMQNMFLSCNNLKKVTVGPNFSINGNGSNTTAANKAILPIPSTDYIEGADGNWYTFNGEAYAPNAMKDKTAETYYASPVMVYDADVIVKNSSLIDTAKAIREKNGATTHYTPAQFGAAIRAL